MKRKLRFTHLWSSGDVYFISDKDQDHFEDVINEWLIYKDDDYNLGYKTPEIEEMIGCLDPKNWNPERFASIYRTLDQDNYYVEVF